MPARYNAVHLPVSYIPITLPKSLRYTAVFSAGGPKNGPSRTWGAARTWSGFLGHCILLTTEGGCRSIFALADNVIEIHLAIYNSITLTQLNSATASKASQFSYSFLALLISMTAFLFLSSS